MSHQLTLQRSNDNVLASADQHGVSIFVGWTVGIPVADAINYVKTINADPKKGFFAHSGKVVLSHGSAKLTLSQQEAIAIIDLIKTAYGVV